MGLPYRIFGFDSAMTDVVRYAQAADRWMKNGGRETARPKTRCCSMNGAPGHLIV